MLPDICRMEISALFLAVISLCGLTSAANLKASGNNLEKQAALTEDRTSAAAPSMKCQLQGSARLPAFSMGGDFVIGGVFALHHYKVTVKHNYTTVPEPFRCRGRLVPAGMLNIQESAKKEMFQCLSFGVSIMCHMKKYLFCAYAYEVCCLISYLSGINMCLSTLSIDPRELRLSHAMVFAIEEINNSMELLPGISLGYQIHDSCAAVPIAVHVAFQLLNGLDPVFHTGDTCSQSGTVMAVVGESGSTPSISISRVIGSFNIPQVNI